MKKFKIILLFLVLVVSNVTAKKIVKKDIDLNELSKIAQQDCKHLLIYFNTNACPSCKKIEKFTLHNKKIKNILSKDFIVVKININDDENVKYNNFFDTKKEFGKYLNIDFYPTIIFMDEEKEIVYTLKGYKIKDKFKNILKYIKTKSYIK